jgi:predicted amidohydrolase YtcJ
MLGIDRETPNPVGGEIVRDASGEPTGLLLETASWNNLERIVPEPTREENAEALRRANRYLLERGITSASDANTSPGDIDLFRDAVVSDTLQVRTNLMVGWAELLAQSGDAIPKPDDLQPTDVSWHRLHVGQAKLFSDGAITTRTCWLNEPFCNTPDNFGMPLHPPDELRELIISAHSAGWQIATHAIGDRAVDLVLNCYAEAQRTKPRRKPGHRIEHCMLLNSDLIARLRRQNVWSVGQPEFLAGLGDAYIAALGEERAFRLSPYASLERHDVAQAFSSDCPVVPGSPLAGIRAAVERRSPNGVILNGSERIGTDSALYAYTAAPAYATFTQRDRGTLEVGKVADLAVLSADPLAAGFSEWDALYVVATIIGGECVFGN